MRAPRACGVGAAAGGFLGFLGEQAHLLDELEQLGAMLADQRLSEKRGDAADIGPQFRGKVGAEMCSVNHEKYLLALGVARTLRWIL